MSYMIGIIELLSSKRPPAFESPLLINFFCLPTEGEMFFFETDGLMGNTSLVVREIETLTDGIRFETSNSVYELRNVSIKVGSPEKPDGEGK